MPQNFKLFDSQKNEVTLLSFRGKKVLLLFFPLAFTSICTKEFCSIRDDFNFYVNLNCQILGISVDSVFCLEKFRIENSINFPLLSDFNKEVSKLYGVLYDEFFLCMKGVAKRSVFVIDKEGFIRYMDILENAGGLPNFYQVKQLLLAM